SVLDPTLHPVTGYADNPENPGNPWLHAARDPRYASRYTPDPAHPGQFIFNPNGGHAEYHIVLLDHADNTPSNLYGNDYIAGGAGEDEIFGQLGNDVIQGDGTIGVASAILADGSDALLHAQLSLTLAVPLPNGSNTYVLPTGFTNFKAYRDAPATTG